MNRSLIADELPPPPRRGGIHVGLLYPGSYAESASALGLHFILGAVRSTPGCSAGRILTAGGRGRPATIEEGAALSSLPVVLVSAGWELMLAPIVETLRRASIPPLCSERDETHPLIVAGGALCVSNPDLLAPVADVLVRGDGEEAMRTLLAGLTAGADRGEILEALSDLPGTSAGTRARCGDGELPARSAFVTPRSALASMHLVEAMRGCPHGCAFCIMSRRCTGSPPRYVPARAVLESVPDTVRRVGLVGPSVLEHPEIEDILAGLADRRLEVGISSARADRVDDTLARLLASLGLRTLTVGLDGASAAIRDRIHKRVGAAEVIRAARTSRRHGIPRLKLYAMLGFEGETQQDVEELASTCLEVSASTHLTVSVGPVVPKKATALEAMPFVSRRQYASRIRSLRRAIGGRARVEAVSWREARVEALLARMDPGAAEELIRTGDLARALKDLPDP
jgi:radical SAM superfamily enzyme YgiQ (UPF0313 family)